MSAEEKHVFWITPRYPREHLKPEVWRLAGVIHVRVVRSEPFSLSIARRALRSELQARVKDLDERRWRFPVRVRDLDDDDSIVCREWGSSEGI